jgi:hypothetical protein
MSRYLFPRFLDDPEEYTKATDYWRQLWEHVHFRARTWRQPWLADALRDGNPMFSAVSDQMRKGVRVIQHPPSRAGTEFVVWLDTFGGSLTDPDSISELVISCALSDSTAIRAIEVMNSWVCQAVVDLRSEVPISPQAGAMESVAA